MKTTTKLEIRAQVQDAKRDLRTLASLALSFASLIALLLLVSCAPKQTDRVYPEAKMDFGPLQQDPDLGLDAAGTLAAPVLKWSESVESARVFRLGEALTKLGETQSRPALSRLGDRVGRAFYKARGTTTKNAFKDSLYISAAIGETKEDVMPIIEENDQMLKAQLTVVQELLAATAKSTQWPTAETSPRDSLLTANQFATRFLERASDSALKKDLYVALRDTFKKDVFPLLESLLGEVDSILAEPRSVIMIDRLRALGKKFEVDFGTETTAMLDQAQEVMANIEKIEKKHDALTVIVQLWEMTDAENREKTFRPVSEDLFKYLDGKSAKDLRCVKNPGCHTPWIWLPKKIGLLPAIEKYGVEKLKVEISKAARDSLIKTLNEEVAKFVPTIPSEIETKVTEQINVIRKKLASVKSDYTGFIRSIAVEYEKQGLKEKGDTDEVVVAGLETKRVKVSFSPGLLDVAPDLSASITVNNSAVTTGAEVIGSSMAYMSSMWSSPVVAQRGTSFTYQKSVLTQVNKMLALGGYRTPSGKPFPSISLSLDRGQPVQHFSIAENLDSQKTFAVPDAFAVSNNLIPAATDLKVKSVSVLAQAELLRGLSGMVRYFRDWEKNGFDETMGSVQIGALIKDLPAGGVDQKLFPKDTFFALAVANGAAILQNMTKELSPIFLIDIERKSAWANERSDEADQPATMAGIVDIVKGQRTETVKAADAAQFLLAIAEFLEATEGIEKTVASPLVTPGEDGKKPVEMISQARTQLSMLIVGLGNFISHEMQAEDGGIRPTYDRKTLTADKKADRTAGEQAVCILALLKAGDVIGKKIYEWPALDAYAFMNRKLFNRATGFYSASESSKVLPAVDEIANILLAGEALKSRMNEKSRKQWVQISAPWLKAFEAL